MPRWSLSLVDAHRLKHVPALAPLLGLGPGQAGWRAGTSGSDKTWRRVSQQCRLPSRARALQASGGKGDASARGARRRRSPSGGAGPRGDDDDDEDDDEEEDEAGQPGAMSWGLRAQPLPLREAADSRRSFSAATLARGLATTAAAAGQAVRRRMHRS